MPVKRAAQPSALRLEVVDWLLDGHVRENDETDPARQTGVYDTFLEFDPPGDLPDLPTLWRAHRAALMIEWRRRGGAGLPWGAQQFDRELPEAS